MGLSLEQAERLGIAELHPDRDKGAAVKPTKYRAVRTAYNGVSYPSKAEAARAAELDRMVKTGSVLWWIGQPRFRLGCPENVYVADFLVVTPGGVHVEDVKGARTAKFNRDAKLWRAYGPCELWVISGNKVETIRPESGQKQGD